MHPLKESPTSEKTKDNSWACLDTSISSKKPALKSKSCSVGFLGSADQQNFFYYEQVLVEDM